MKLRWLNPFVQHILPSIAAGFSNIVGRTTQLTIFSPPNLSTKKEQFHWKNGVIFCIWHARFFYFSYYGKATATVPMISNSRDGELIVRIIRKMRLHAIRGSSSKHGQEMMYNGVELLKLGYNLMITPDGPRGPRYQLKPGVIRLAQLSGSPILPASFSSTSGIFLPNWDRFFIPLPCGRAALTVGDPIYVPAELSTEEFEQYRIQLEKVMNEIREQADTFCQRDPEKEVHKMWKKSKIRP